MRRRRFRIGLGGGVAAAFVVAAVVGYAVLGGGVALTLADVMAATAEKTWLHVKYDNGREQWALPAEGLTYYKEEGGGATFVNSRLNIRHTYLPGSGAIYENTPHIYPEGKRPEWKPRTVWEYVLGRYAEKSLEAGRQKEQIDGKTEANGRYEFDDLSTYPDAAFGGGERKGKVALVPVDAAFPCRLEHPTLVALEHREERAARRHEDQPGLRASS